MTTTELTSRHEAVQRLARQAGLVEPLRLKRLAGGRNNRVYQLSDAARSSLLKWYFRHPDDPRDRLAAEFRFTQFAWNHGIRDVPEPLVADPDEGMALFEFVEGRPLVAADVTSQHVHCAARLFQRLQGHSSDPKASTLPTASEACFSLEAHLECTERRMTALESLDESTRWHRQARQLVGDKLRPQWAAIKDRVQRGNHLPSGGPSLPPTAELPPDQRCISPSDFGFHNALLANDGVLRFVDFEYAGWDDPAKMICDFFCQVQIPVSLQYLNSFTATSLDGFPEPSAVLGRTKLLLPVYRIKWCCIVLNEFLPTGQARRDFNLEASLDERLERQLARAVDLVEYIHDEIPE